MEHLIESIAKEAKDFFDKKLKLECFQISLDMAKSLGYIEENKWDRMNNAERIDIMTEIYKNASHTFNFISETKKEEG
jgi:hypothetical protein